MILFLGGNFWYVHWFLNRVMLLQMNWDYDINQMLYRFHILVSPLQPFFWGWQSDYVKSCSCVVFVKKIWQIWHLLSSQRCMTIEQMNSGSVQNWLDKEMLSPQGILGRLRACYLLWVLVTYWFAKLRRRQIWLKKNGSSECSWFLVQCNVWCWFFMLSRDCFDKPWTQLNTRLWHESKIFHFTNTSRMMVVLKEVAAALAYMHANEITHNDMKCFVLKISVEFRISALLGFGLW